ncbi:transcription regulator protein BACH1b [Notolabrus celidotus]|uniref:transcription regulator protein BACH1b n=1 Tax=Notolabrus celidotus TaxID=1203425 RepID=UPI0014902C1A|nr:transcription regulator protein BACH1b [Notolabrus celidotus]
MAVLAPRSSVFTFESTVHSSHVLRRLDEQRRRDTLCDVTVVVDGQSFRAHRSVLASCSEYFTHRISALAQHGAIITLPQEVTVAGFEPLLKFAYTSKLLFGKDDVLEVRNSASILGFRDLDDACFDFLLPKFFSSTQDSATFPRKTCCKKNCKGRSSKDDSAINSDDILLDEKEVKPVADSPFQQEVAFLCNKSVNSQMGSQSSLSTVTPVAEGTSYPVNQGPKYRKFQLACGKEACFTEKSRNSPVTLNKDDCELSCSPCSSSVNIKNESEAGPSGSSFSNLIRQSKSEANDTRKCVIDGQKAEAEVDIIKREAEEVQGKWSENKMDVDVEEDTGFSDLPPLASGLSTAPCEGSSGLILHHCPLKTLSDPAITGSPGHKRFSMVITEDIKTRGAGAQVSIPHEVEEERLAKQEKANDGIEGGLNCSMERAAMSVSNARERSAVEREVAEHLAKRLGSDGSTNFQDLNARSSSDSRSVQGGQSASLERLHVNLSSSTSTSCPFFIDLESNKCLWKGAELSECEGTSQSGVSSFNSGDDGDSETETEGDSEAFTQERARQMQLPFSVDWIVDLSRNDFQQLLKQQVLTHEQLEFVHDMRRRSKNRLAAQRCRKRKLDCIHNLQCEINKLRTEREKLMTERSHLSQLKLTTCHNVSSLCQKVCNEANLQPDQLQVLTKYTSPDCPLSSFSPHIDALLSQSPLLTSSVGSHQYTASEGGLPSSSRDTVTGDGRQQL